MANPYNETKARARIVTVLEAVTDIGKVHNYERLFDDWEKLMDVIVATIDDEKEIRSWMVNLDQIESVDPDDSEFMGGFGAPDASGTRHVRYHYQIRGIMGVEDARATDLIFLALLFEVLDDLNSDVQLHSGDVENGANSYFAGQHASATQIEPRMYAGVLCHYALIELILEEVV